MKPSYKITRILGVAFLLQFITSILSGVVLRPALIVPDNIAASMQNIANQPGLMRLTILVDMLTALGIIFLGAMLFLTLRKQNEKMALVALGFYVLEAALLAASRSQAFSLLGLSQAYAAGGDPAYLQLLGSLALGSMDFVGSTLHVLVFCLGAILFYSLLYTSNVVPRVLSLWGLITVFPMLIAIVLDIFGVTLPFYLIIPYIPFEFVIGIWILIKGIRVTAEIDQPLPVQSLQPSSRAAA
ncbi:MAG: DUF4386 domain-containing protein [Anaerolineales bacterium]